MYISSSSSTLNTSVRYLLLKAISMSSPMAAQGISSLLRPISLLADISIISREMENPEGEIPPEEGEVRNQKLWVLSGNGTVFTPCLKKSEGNLHFSLFDYRNEVVPNQALQNLFGELFEEGDE